MKHLFAKWLSALLIAALLMTSTAWMETGTGLPEVETEQDVVVPETVAAEDGEDAEPENAETESDISEDIISEEDPIIEQAEAAVAAQAALEFEPTYEEPDSEDAGSIVDAVDPIVSVDGEVEFISEEPAGEMNVSFEEGYGTTTDDGFEIDNYGSLTGYTGSGGDIVIPDSVTGIDCNVFVDNDTITSVVVPGSVKTLNSYTFNGCSALTSITLLEGVSTIESYAISGCTALSNLIIPRTVTSIKENSINNCNALTNITIPAQVTHLDKSIFSGWSNLKNVTIIAGTGENGTSVDSFFSTNISTDTSLESVTIDEGVTSIMDYAFNECRKLKRITLPNSLKSIGAYVFINTILESIEIPGSVETIDTGAIMGCSLKTVVLGEGITSIPTMMFSQCSQLTNVTIPSTVTSIGEGAFSGCSSLKSIQIPNSVTSIGKQAFSSCSSLESIQIPDSVTSIGEQAFFGSGLKHITIPGNVKAIGKCAFAVNTDTYINVNATSSLESVVIENGVETIGDYAFYYCNNLKDVVIPDSITSVGQHAFDHCTKLSSVIFTNTTGAVSKTNINYYAFEQCTQLADIAIPVSVNSVNNFAFNGLYNTLTLHIDCRNTAIVSWAKTTWTNKNGKYTVEHEWNAPTYTWADDNRSVTATRKCSHDETHVETETVNTTSEITKAAKCEAKGETTYTATFENTVFETQTRTVEDVNALGHDWNAPTYTWANDNSSVTATRKCGHDETHVETETVNTTSEITKAATCEIKGETTYTATFENAAFETQTKTVDNIDVLTHDWKDPTYTWADDNSTVTATRKCNNDETHVETETVKTTSEITKAATCEAEGETTYTATFENAAFGTQTKTLEDVRALGHDWNAPTYTWANDNSTVTASRKCSHDETHEETETVNTTSEITKAAKCEAKGETTYTAKFTNTAFETQTKTVDNIDALTHDWEDPTYTWADDNRSVTATRKCSHDETHVETETVNTTSEITKAAKCEAKGETTYTATFENTVFETQTRTVEDVNALGHDWNAPTYTWANDNSTVTASRKCSHDETHEETETVNTTSEITKAAKCEAKGETTYTAKFTNTAFETQTKTLANIDATGHTEVQDEAVAATCSKVGKTAGTHCSVCGKVLVEQETIAKLPHTPVILPARAATTTQTGLTEGQQCSVCGAILVPQRQIAKLPVPTPQPSQPTPAPVQPAAPGITEVHLGGNATRGVIVGDVFKIIADGKTVKSYKSSKRSVATVASDGTVTARKAGKTKITVTYKQGKKNKKLVMTLKVTDPTAPTRVYFAQGKSVTLKVGETLQLTPAMTPDTAVSTFKWKSSKKKVAAVDGNGLVTAKKKGTAKITVTTKNKKKATIKIKVVK